MTELYLQMVVALILVTAVIVFLGLVMKKKQGKDGLMKVLGYQSLGPKKGIAMVRIGQEVLVVGVTATDVKLLKTYDGPSEEEQTPGKTPVKATVADITDKLKRLKDMKDSLYAIK